MSTNISLSPRDLSIDIEPTLLNQGFRSNRQSKYCGRTLILNFCRWFLPDVYSFLASCSQRTILFDRYWLFAFKKPLSCPLRLPLLSVYYYSSCVCLVLVPSSPLFCISCLSRLTLPMSLVFSHYLCYLSRIALRYLLFPNVHEVLCRSFLHYRTPRVLLQD